MNQPPQFEGSRGAQITREQTGSSDDSSSGGVLLGSDSIMSDYSSEGEDDDPYSTVDFSSPEASLQDAFQHCSTVRTDLRKVDTVAKEARAFANQELLNGTQLNTAGKAYYSEEFEDLVAQGKSHLGDLRSSLQVVQSSALFADGQLAQTEVNDRHHELEHSERALARQQLTLERREQSMKERREMLNDDRETLEQQQNVLEADQVHHRMDCDEFNTRVSELEQEEAEMERDRTVLDGQIRAFNEQAEAQDQAREYLRQKRAEPQRRDAANREQEQMLARERARMAACHRSLVDVSELVPQFEHIIDRAGATLEWLRGALAGPQQGLIPQSPYVPSVASPHGPAMTYDPYPGTVVTQPYMQNHAGLNYDYDHQGQWHGDPQQENLWFDQHGHHRQQGAESGLSPYLRPFGSDQQQTAYASPEHVHASNAVIENQQPQHWSPVAHGNSSTQQPVGNGERLAAHSDANLGNFSVVAAQENIAPRRPWPEQDLSFYDRQEHINRVSELPAEPDNFGPFELDAQQDGVGGNVGPRSLHEELSQHEELLEIDVSQHDERSPNEESNEIDLDQPDADPDDQLSEDEEESDGDSDSDSDEESPVDHDWDGTYRSHINDIDADNFEDDVEPIDTD